MSAKGWFVIALFEEVVLLSDERVLDGAITPSRAVKSDVLVASLVHRDLAEGTLEPLLRVDSPDEVRTMGAEGWLVEEF